jgi:para-aminobenzoate synthetase/4-amino-4-deoxychorismate lyase
LLSTGDQTGWNAAFSNPQAIREAEILADVPRLVSFVREACDAGKWAVLALAYEAAPAFDPALAAHGPRSFPLAYAAIYATPDPDPPRIGTPGPGQGTGAYARSPWRPRVSRRRYLADLARVRAALRAGESYQVNKAMPFEALFSGDARAWFEDLLPGQAAGYAAYLELPGRRVLCFSPELFFRRRGREVTARPMKGTMPRGAGPEEDAALARRLAVCPKNRAENVMIVDLLRSDLGRVAETGSVAVRRLFTVEAYPTVWQMTSEISARLRPGLGLFELFQALFPCGSVTGAPKVRTLDIIRELEGRPRGIYCGALGFVRPGGDCDFCVPIRTVSLEKATGRAVYWTGGGVTIDSDPGGEYSEWLVKMRFLDRGRPSFRLLETILLETGGYALLSGHLRRMRAAARVLGFPFREKAARRALDAALAGREIGGFGCGLPLDARAGSSPGRPLGLVPGSCASACPDAGLVRGHALRHKTDWRGRYNRARRSGRTATTCCFCQRARPDHRDHHRQRGRAPRGTLVTPPVSEGLCPACSGNLCVGERRGGAIPIEGVRAAGVWSFSIRFGAGCGGELAEGDWVPAPGPSDAEACDRLPWRPYRPPSIG